MCAEARGEKAETACTNEACRLHGGRGSMALCRVKRNILVFIVMCCSVLWIAMLTVGFSCCAVVQQAVITSSEGQVQRLDELAAQDRATYRHLAKENAMSKKLLQDTSSWTQVQNSRLSPAGVQHSPDHRAALSDHQVVVYDYEELSDSNSEQDDNRNHFSEHTNHDRTSPGPIQRVGATGTKKLPQAIIIGVKKGGTRALLEFLRIHPDVRAPGPETHFFDRYYHKGLQWYRLEMPPTMEGQMTIEKTPSYFITKEVPRRIFSMSPNIKLIVVVRDPVTRAISDYTQAASKRPGMKPFEHMAFLDNYTGLVNTSWGAIRIGVYAKHLDKWLKYFPLSQMHFVSGEKLITDPAGQMARVQDFLGLKRVISEKHFYFNETKGFPCLKKTEGSGRPHCLGKSKGRQHPKVGPRLLQRLRDFFRPFNAKFYQMVGQDFGWP